MKAEQMITFEPSLYFPDNAFAGYSCSPKLPYAVSMSAQEKYNEWMKEHSEVEVTERKLSRDENGFEVITLFYRK